MRDLKYFFWLITLAFLISCSNAANDLGSSFNITQSPDLESSSSQENVPNTSSSDILSSESGKSSDDDEGIPGYMNNIDTVEASIQDDQYVITVPSQSVARALDRAVFATVWTISSDAIDSDTKVIKEGQSSTAVFVGSVQIGLDGSFAYTADRPADDDKLVVGISFESNPASLRFYSDLSGVYAGFYIKESTKDNSDDGNGNNDRGDNNNRDGNNRNNNNQQRLSLQDATSYQQQDDSGVTVELKIKGLYGSDPSLVP